MTPEEEEADYVKKSDEMQRLFPNAANKFCLDVDDLERLDSELIPSKNAVILYPLKCIVCDPDREGSVVIPVNRKHNITYRDFYEECHKHWHDELCNHQFLEGFDVLTESQITPSFGS